MYERREGKVNRCQAPKKKSLKREGAGMREPFHRECFYVTGTHFLFKKTMPGPNFFDFQNNFKDY